MTAPRLSTRGPLADILRAETTGGLLLLAATVLALVLANSPLSGAYHDLSAWRIGPLALSSWASDGLLAVFFFVAGLELKREFVAGDLRDPRRAALPVAAAVGGMAVPALLYTLINVSAAGGVPRGWAIPTATDIAFALAVLALVNTHLPPALRTFLLTLAVVDDLLAITIIAIFYTSSLHLLPLLLAVLPLAAFGVLVQRRVRAWWALLPLAAATWFLVYESGVHATVAGVLLAFTVPAAEPALAGHFEHRWRPLSTGVAVPVFAFFAAGVSVQGPLNASVTAGIVVGLVVGKTVGILGATWLVQRFTRAELAAELSWWDLLGLAMLGGVGFTVSLLIGELALQPGDQSAKAGVLTASLVAALLAATVLKIRDRRYRREQRAR